MPKKLCRNGCGRVAEIPDRNKQFGRQIKAICKECHMDLLRRDLAYIMDRYEKTLKAPATDEQKEKEEYDSRPR